MDDLRRMAIFAAVVDAGSFTAAARTLGLTKSAVSKQLALLEDRHGVRLLQRTTRRVTPTEAGIAFHRRCAEIVATAEAALGELVTHGDRPRGRLRISVPLGLADPFLAAPLAVFLQQHPDVHAEIEVSDELVDLVGEGWDLAIRAGQLRDSGLVARRIAPLELVIIAAASRFTRARAPRSPADLARHPFIVYGPLGNPHRLKFQCGRRRATVRTTGRVVTNSGPVLRRLVLAGLGLGLLPRFFVADDLATGALVEVLPRWSLPAAAIYAVFASSQHVPPKVRHFVDHVAAWHAGVTRSSSRTATAGARSVRRGP
jgi:DNA-binding transcriptional LysR family regulator